MIKLSDEQISSKIQFIQQYISASNAATGSTLDANANVSSKNIATLSAEIYKDFTIQINRKIIQNKIEKLFTKKLSKQYIRDIEDHLIYIHDESSLNPYCVAISMYPFLTDGLKLLGGESGAPKHLESFCGSFGNLIFAISSQFAGAVATPEFLLCFDYFARKDYGDNYLIDQENLIKQKLQHVVYVLNQPAAARGYQCVRSDKTQLSTPNGYKYLHELSVGDNCYVWKDGKIEIEKIEYLNVYDYDGELMQFKGRNYQQTVTPNHRVVYKKANTDKYEIKEAHELFGHSKLSLPIGSNGIDRDDYPISDTLLKLCVATLTDGTIDEYLENDNNSGRLSIYKSKNRYGYNEVKEWLAELGIGFSENTINSEFGDVQKIRLTTLESQIILRTIKHTKKVVPEFFRLLSKRQVDIVIDCWSRFDGNNDNEHMQLLQCDNDDIRNMIQEMVFLAGYGSEIYDRKMTKFKSDEECIVKYVKIFSRKDKRVSEYNLVNYKGKVWCPTTKAGVVIFREENGIPYVSGNSVFWNLSTFDKYFYEGLFKDFRFPDASEPNWETLDKLQRFFHIWFRKEREKELLTFPVVTHSFLTDGEDILDKEGKNFIADEMSLGGEFFIYTSNSVDSLSSCCFHKDQMTLSKSSNGINYMSFEELHNSKYGDYKRNFTIFHNGSWVKGKTIKLPNRDMYKITTMNNKEIIVSDNHLNPTINGNIATCNLNTSDYLLFNTNKLDSYPEKDLKLTYDQGIAVGAFLGDGSFGTRHHLDDGSVLIYDTHFSLNSSCITFLKNSIDKANIDCGGKNELKYSIIDNLYAARISSKELSKFITDWTSGTSANTKSLNLNCLLQSYEFRKGILDGWYATDGGNSNRCYTVSPSLAETMEVLITSLGLVTTIETRDRTGEVEIKGETYNRNFPSICVRWYDPKNKRSMNDVYIYKNNSIYFKIKSIEKIDYYDDIYCFEIENINEPYFTLPNGIITHNCRLKNAIDKNEFSYSLGGGGVMTGSKNVITLNINRIIQEGHNLDLILDRVYKYQLAFDDLYKELYELNMLTVYTAGFINLKKQFLTIGINGVVEAAEYLGYQISNNSEYKQWLKSFLINFKNKNKEASIKYGVKFNTEFVPAENLGVKNAKWDKADGLVVKRNVYNSYMYIVEDSYLSIFDKMELQGGEIIGNLDGGSAFHFNNEERLSKEQYLIILQALVKTGCNYFCENVPKTICNSCGYIHANNTKKCIKCESEDVDKATRIIGYLKRIKNFVIERQHEEGRRFYHND